MPAPPEDVYQTPPPPMDEPPWAPENYIEKGLFSKKKGKNKNRRKQQPGNKYYAEIFMVLGAMSERNNNNNNPNCFSYMPALFE